MAWQRVAIVIEGARAEPLAVALEEAGAVATDLADADAGTDREQAIFGEPGSDVAPWPQCRLTALFPADAALDRILERAARECGLGSLMGASIDRLEDADWVTLTQRQFEPIRAGTRLWIVPTWHEAPDPAALNIVLDPGAAFGTGSHPTTRLCLGWLEGAVRAGDAILDYGCGSGILAIAALRLGAGRATGVDVDPLAIEAARYNASRNRVALEVLDGRQRLPDAYDITVANILANPLRMLAPLIGERTRPAGAIALSGILQSQADAVIDAYAPWATLRIAGEEGGWVLLAGERRA